MSKPRRKLGKPAGQTVTRPNPRKVKFITSAEARRRAERHVLDWMFRGATVRDGANARLRIYNRGDWSANNVWVVYKNPKEIALKSAEVILVCKRTGRVLYEGSAGDEG
jgi:hypothetical protein